MDYSRRDFVRTLFIASQATLWGRFASGAFPTDDLPGEHLHFLVIGDWGRHGRTDQRQVAQQMAAAAKDHKAAFVIAAGDNFYENGVASADDPQWEQSFETVYDAPSLQVPWYAILGNHDYHGNCDAQLDYARTHPRWKMPARYYSQVHAIDPDTKLEMFFIDTSPMIKAYLNGEKPEHPKLREHVLTQDVPSQVQWLQTALAESTARWKVVIGHHPIYSGGVHGDQPELIETILPLLHKNNVHAYFCGHDHDLQHLKAGRVNLFVSGGGSEHRPNHGTPHTEFRKSASGFMAVALNKDAMHVRVIDNLGNPLYATPVLEAA